MTPILKHETWECYDPERRENVVRHKVVADARHVEDDWKTVWKALGVTVDAGIPDVKLDAYNRTYVFTWSEPAPVPDRAKLDPKNGPLDAGSAASGFFRQAVQDLVHAARRRDILPCARPRLVISVEDAYKLARSAEFQDYLGRLNPPGFPDCTWKAWQTRNARWGLPEFIFGCELFVSDVQPEGEMDLWTDHHDEPVIMNWE